MMKAFKRILTVSLPLLTILAMGQGNVNDSICWRADYQLKWTDFKGAKKAGERWKAATSAGIYVNGYRDKDGLPNYRVRNCFSKRLSWTTDTTSLTLLAHEQLHFDIAELYARKIRKAIEALREKKLKKYSSYDPVIDQLLIEREAMDDKYDKDCVHGTFLDIQNEWSEKIAKELALLQRYAE